ncbi:MAG: T9SS type A sorting domain-containing protein [Bacteroidota bacterium]
MRIALLIICIYFGFSRAAFPCSYVAREFPFCGIGNSPNLLLASGKIVKKINRGYIIELSSVYKGSEERCEIKIFERADWDCTGIPFIYKIEYMGDVGDEILFIAEKMDAANESWQEDGEYLSAYVSINNEDPFTRPLKRRGNRFRGLFAEGKNSVAVNRVFKELQDCGVEGLLAEERVLCGSLPLKLYPNPAKEKVFLDQNSESYEEILIYDLKGNLVEKYGGYDPANGLNISGLSPGIYFVQAKSGQFVFRQKLLVN